MDTKAYEKEFWIEQQIACMLSEDYVLNVEQNKNLEE
jgi:hypothetical protein